MERNDAEELIKVLYGKLAAKDLLIKERDKTISDFEFLTGASKGDVRYAANTIAELEEVIKEREEEIERLKEAEKFDCDLLQKGLDKRQDLKSEIRTLHKHLEACREALSNWKSCVAMAESFGGKSIEWKDVLKFNNEVLAALPSLGVKE